MLTLSWSVFSVWAEPPIEVELGRHEVSFREHILFEVRARGEAEITGITLFYRVTGRRVIHRVPLRFEPDRRVEVEYAWDLSDGSLPPEVEVAYWWEVADRLGRVSKIGPRFLLYTDDRYDWRTLASSRVTLHWYRGDEEFGQALFEEALEALEVLSRDAGVTVPRQVQVVIYGSRADLRGVLVEGAPEWMGAQAFADVGVVVISIPPEDLASRRRAVRHELSHLVVHRRVDTSLGDLPRWLDEGLAMYAEGELGDEFRRALEGAIREGRLFSLRSLCSSFPADPELACLCYAQSYSLVEFILEEYGQEKMGELLEVLDESSGCDEALERVLGVDGEGLDGAWRRWVEGQGAYSTPRVSWLSQLALEGGIRIWVGLSCGGGVLLVAGGWLLLRVGRGGF